MKFISFDVLVAILICSPATTNAFVHTSRRLVRNNPTRPVFSGSALRISSIGLGPDEQKKSDEGGEGSEEESGSEPEPERELVAGVDYEIPDHEAYRTSRRSTIDEKCDVWFESMLGGESNIGILGSVAEDARKTLLTPVPLVNEEALPIDHPEYTPYVTTKLPWTPLVPAYGLEQFGLPVPRRNAEAWRQFDVPGLIGQDYFGTVEGHGTPMELNEEEIAKYQKELDDKGGWLADDACYARLVYVNGRFVPGLSKTNDEVQNIGSVDDASDDLKTYLARLTDGFTDELAAPVPIGDDDYWTSFKKLSLPNHHIGEPFSQFAINTQQGTAAFAALNTVRTGAVAYICTPEGFESEDNKPILVVNAITKDGGISAENNSDGGVAQHPRCVVVAGKASTVDIIQACVDMDSDTDPVPTMCNGYTQIFIESNATVAHSYLEESGGLVTGDVESSDDSYEEGETPARVLELKRPALKNTKFETIDVHAVGENARYEATVVSVGGSGRVRTGTSVSLLKPGSHATINGFSLSGGAQRVDCRTTIHHIAQGTTSEQVQKNMIGGRSTGAFRGRIRVEQSAQQTDSQQLCRTVLLSDKSRAWAIPTLEIIADDVQCTHGATVSDLSEEELFYLRSRGLSRKSARNLLMFAFANDICSSVNPSMLAALGTDKGLQKRLIDRLENVTPRGDRAVKGEFSSI